MKKKTMKIKLLLVSLILNTAIGFGQDDQTVQAKNIMDESEYMGYSVKHDRKTKNFSVIGVTARVWEMTFKDYHKNFKEVIVQNVVGGKKPAHHYFPDEEAFPVTYVYGAWLGGPEEIAKYDVVERKEDKRMVIVGEWVYILEKWKSKDDYLIVDVLKKGKISKIAGLRQSLKYKKNDPGAEFKKKLQDYLDIGFMKQAELLPAWKIKNSGLINKRIENYKACWASINDENDVYWASPAGQSKLARMRGEGQHADKYFTIVNTGNSTLKFYSAGMLQTILAGRSKKMNCTYDIYGVIKEGTTSKKGNLIYDGDDICGKTINMK